MNADKILLSNLRSIFAHNVLPGPSQKKNFATETQRTQRKREEKRSNFSKTDQFFLISVSLCLCGALLGQPWLR